MSAGRLSIENSGAGGVRPRAEFSAFKMIRYKGSTYDTISLCFVMVCVVWIVRLPPLRAEWREGGGCVCGGFVFIGGGARVVLAGV